MRQPEMEIQSRFQEESQIVVKWLARFHQCLQDQSPRLFEEAIARTRLSNEQLRSGEGLTQEHFDAAMDFVRRRFPDIIFRFMRELDLHDLGMLGYAVLSCPTVGKGLSLMARYLELTSDRYTEDHFVEGDFHIIRPASTWRHLGEDESIAEDCLCGNWQAVRLMLGPESDYHGAHARFAYPPPPHLDAYRAYFEPCKVHFDAEHTELRIPLSWLERPVTTANAMVSDVTSSICERLLGPGRTTRVDTARAVRRLLLSRPGKRMLRLEEAAEELRMSTAQLRKRLYRAGTSYKSIVLEVRMKLARHYLESTHLSIQEIAYLLDYSQPGPFSRAFKKYFGHPPNSVRKEPQPTPSPAL
ncbi:MAG: helix-turn-helix domain-containing protein [Xanthomonadales bacterium]|nr:helix-turn-helix domain-containing protein [Xanthomonadales bacterium]